MTNITVQDLQDIAVKCVSEFFNNKMPLNEGLAKEASYRNLNSEQLKRAIEATNTLAHLKSIDVSNDRTVEFPVANYNEIVKLAFVPELENSVHSSNPANEDPALFAKQAQELMASNTDVSFTYEEAVSQLRKKAAVAERALEDAKFELMNVAESFLQKAAEIKTDPELLEKLSVSSASKQYFQKLANVLGINSPRKSLPEGMFKAASIDKIEELLSLYKRAEALNIEIKEKSDLKLKLDDAVNIHIKSAALLGRASNFLGSGIGKVVSAPVKGLINAGIGTTKAVGKSINNLAAKTSMGQAAGLTPKPQSPLAKGLAVSAMPALGAALDISAYGYKAKPSSNQLGTVWDNLQG